MKNKLFVIEYNQNKPQSILIALRLILKQAGHIKLQLSPLYMGIIYSLDTSHYNLYNRYI